MIAGSQAAIDRVHRLIDEWEQARSGCLEEFAEWVIIRRATLDDGLDEMVRRSLITDWRVTTNEAGEPKKPLPQMPEVRAGNSKNVQD